MSGVLPELSAPLRRQGRSRRERAQHSAWRRAVWVLLAATLLAPASGCTRSFFRKGADTEVEEILAQKDKYPAWAIENWWVYPHPLARFADPTNPDHPPKPPDDPAAYNLSPNPQKPGKAGVERFEGTGYLELIAQWDRENREKRAKREAEEARESGEPPVDESPAQLGPPIRTGPAPQPTLSGQAARSSMPTGTAPGETIEDVTKPTGLDIRGRPAYLLTLEQAAELAMFNSREYQDRRESLYLAALPVTAERFSFAAQFFAAEEAIREYRGRKSELGHTNDWTLNSGTGFSKVLPTGALLLFNFSNQTVFQFLNPKKTTSVTTLDFSAIQPLLRGGGRAVTLESLTQAERNLLYQIRSYARFRKEEYVAIASNSGGSISGGSFQPTGVLAPNITSPIIGAGGSGLFPGVPPNVRTTISSAEFPPSNPGFLALSSAIAPPATGYLNTMLQNIQVYIDKENIDVLTAILERYRGLLEGDVVGPLQVQNVEQQLLSGRSTLLSDQQQYLDSLDGFKLQIGVPTQLSIEMDDSELRPLMRQFRRSRAIIEDEQASVAEASRLITLAQAPRLRAELLRLFQQSPLARGTPFARRIRDRLRPWERMSDAELKQRLEVIRRQTQRLLELRADLQNRGQSLTPADQARLKELGSEADLGNYERVLRRYEADYTTDGRPRKVDAIAERRRITQFRDVISLWQKILVEARDDRWAAVRRSWPELPRCCVDGHDLVKENLTTSEEVAARHALLNRLDLMNVRAQLVDAWRQLAVFANALLGVFNVQYHLTANSPPGHALPTDIGGSGTAHQLVLNGELPLVRVQERNNYRSSLIAFQRERRALEEAEDLAVRAVRGEIHSLRVFAENYRIQQRQLELAYLTIDSSLEALQAPTPPGPARTAQDGPAALTQQLLMAQRTLPTAQNGLLTVWINYLNARLQLYRDLELMPLDARGVWIDEIRDCDCSLNPEQPGRPGGESGGAERLPEPRKLPPAGPEPLPQPRPGPPAPGPRLD
jgi:hypothetical protein